MRLKDVRVGMTFRRCDTPDDTATVTGFSKSVTKLGYVKTWIYLKRNESNDIGIKTDIGCLNTYWKETGK